MPNMADISPGQALIFSVVENNNTECKFRLYNGEEGYVSSSVLNFLELDLLALPAVVTVDRLTSAMYKNSVSVSDVLIQLIQKADTEYVKKLIQGRVSIDRFREFVATTPSLETMNVELLKKADLDYVNSALHEKVDRGAVLTVDELYTVLLQFLGARAVYDIADRDALEYGTNPFVWVLDASGDDDPKVKSPALYKWNKTHWVYLGTVGDFGQGGSGDMSNYYTIPEVDALLALVLPPINGVEDQDKVIAVIKDTVDGQEVFKYALKAQPQIDTAYLELAIYNEVRDRQNADIGLQNQINAHEDRIVELENKPDAEPVDLEPILNRLSTVEGRVTIVENTLGYVDTQVTNLIGAEFDREV